jgi:hypothetical protein
MRLLFAASATLAIAIAGGPAAALRAATPQPSALPSPESTPEPAATVSAAPDYVAVVGPVHGAWLVDGKAATLGEKLAAGASFAQARAGETGSIAIYAFDGRLIAKSCPSDPGCGGPFRLDPLGDTAGVKSVVQDATRALPRYRFVFATPGPQSAPPGPERANATPVDAVAPLASDGAVDLGDLMQGVAFGPYRIVLRPLDTHAGFTPAGDPIIKLVTWNGEAVSVAVGGVPEGLYALQLFSRDVASRPLGGPAWAAVIPVSGIGGARGEAAHAGFKTAQTIAAKWPDPEARQLFLRSYLVNAVFPPPTPGPGRRGRRT